MSKLFIYYSNSGNGDVVASKMKDLGYDIRKVLTNYKLSKNLFLACIKGGFHATIKKKAKLNNYNNDVTNYDEICIGSPIWNGRFSCPINTVLKNTNLENKLLTFILYSGGGEAKKAYQRILKEYPTAKIIILKQPKSNLGELDRIEELL
ncbi:MAG: hypothetical protein IKP12_05335 [Acholeplasmatales bacterium]|nr:hypothetical protein [Acholeplasmatales bacterium]